MRSTFCSTRSTVLFEASRLFCSTRSTVLLDTLDVLFEALDVSRDALDILRHRRLALVQADLLLSDVVEPAVDHRELIANLPAHLLNLFRDDPYGTRHGKRGREHQGANAEDIGGDVRHGSYCSIGVPQVRVEASSPAQSTGSASSLCVGSGWKNVCETDRGTTQPLATGSAAQGPRPLYAERNR